MILKATPYSLRVGRQTERQTDRQAGRQTDRYTDRQMIVILWLFGPSNPYKNS